MCQISVVVERESGREKIMDNVTGLVVTPAGVSLSTFFEEPEEIRNVHITSIDFLGGTVVLGESPPPTGKEG
ncbi:MAG: CooT family nickel-binding protein [Desulfobulbaceae bacterium]|nr:CooT family nickel-binding protein [Desulfobulbaceae bacterium]